MQKDLLCQLNFSNKISGAVPMSIVGRELCSLLIEVLHLSLEVDDLWITERSHYLKAKKGTFKRMRRLLNIFS
jgi:hypothetical protein